jgi:putative hemolysin
MTNTIFIYIFIILLGFSLAACEAKDGEITNPASLHCEEQGGTVDIRAAADGGQLGYCVFDDGSECEEWSFFRGICMTGESNLFPPVENPASVYCEQQGGTVDIRTITDGSQIGYCVFDDSSECEEWSFLRDECAPETQGTAP